MRVGIFTNRYKDEDFNLTKRLIAALEASGVDFVLHRDIAEVLPAAPVFDLDEKKTPELMITVGGDGTILQISEYCARHNAAILGLNLGFTGFLTEFEPEETELLAQLIKKGKYTTERRNLLVATLNGESFFALNDVVVLREPGSRMPEIQIEIGGELADRYHCDGFIVSTPTGSTAYSLSAGGPILSPRAGAMALTPITPHSLHSRPMVISDTELVSATVCGTNVRTQLCVDGRNVAVAGTGQVVKVSKSDLFVSFVRRSDGEGAGFYGKLLKKLNKWGNSDTGR